MTPPISPTASTTCRRPTDLHLHEHDGLNHRELPCRGCVASSSSRQIESTRPVKDVTEVTWHVALCLVAIEAPSRLAGMPRPGRPTQKRFPKPRVAGSFPAEGTGEIVERSPIPRFQTFVRSRNQATVVATASGNGVARQPKDPSNLLLSTTHGRSD